MKETKRRFETYSFYDHTGIVLHLEQMAQKGWLIERITNFGWIYHRIEPKKLHFSVSYYPKASEFDPEPSEDQKAFHDFCGHTGWILAASSAQMQVFYNEQERPIPIETDPVVEIDTIHCAAKKNFLPVYILLLAISILDCFVLFPFRLLGDPISVFASTANLFTGFVWILMFLLCAVELGGYYRWRHKAQKAAEQGEFLETTGHAKFQRVILWMLLFGLAYYLIHLFGTGSTLMRVVSVLMIFYIVGLFFVVNTIKQFLKMRKASAGINRTVTLASGFLLSFAMMGAIIFGTLKAVSSGVLEPNRKTYEYEGHNFNLYLDELPLTVEDLMDVKYTDGYIRERRSDETLLLGKFVMRQHARLDAKHRLEMPDLEYTIIQIKVPVLYDMCKNALIHAKKDEVMDGEVIFADHYDVVDPAPWGAIEAYQHYWGQNYRNSYLLCYGDRMVEITFYWEPTPEQMQIVSEKLGLS